MDLTDAGLRERLGRLVRDVWIAWAKEQVAPKESWLLSWEELTEAQREVDRRIGIALRDAARAVPPCGTCGGVPPASGKVCICGGRNTIYAEVQGLREALFDARAEQRERDATTLDVAEQMARDAGVMHDGRGEPGRESACFFWIRVKAFQSAAAAIRAQGAT